MSIKWLRNWLNLLGSPSPFLITIQGIPHQVTSILKIYVSHQGYNRRVQVKLSQELL